jgi:hypothetical protein
MRWLVRVDELMMLPIVLMGFIGTLVTTPKNRALLWGAWIGYFLFGLTFPYHTLTHDYYHLPLVALVAFSIPPLVSFIIEKTSQQGGLVQFILAGVMLVFMVYNGWIGRSVIVAQDYNNHPKYWSTVADAIPHNGNVIGASQDYGTRLMYYGWRKIEIWPFGVGIADFDERIKNFGYFVITAPGQLREDLKNHLDANYPVYAQGEGFVIYDLKP